VSNRVLLALETHSNLPSNGAVLSDIFYGLLHEFVYWDIFNGGYSGLIPALVKNLVAIVTHMPVDALRSYWVARMLATAGLIMNDLTSMSSSRLERARRRTAINGLDTDCLLFLGFAAIVRASTSRNNPGDTVCPADELEVIFQRLLELNISWDSADVPLPFPLEHTTSLNQYVFQALSGYHLRHSSAATAESSVLISLSTLSDPYVLRPPWFNEIMGELLVGSASNALRTHCLEFLYRRAQSLSMPLLETALYGAIHLTKIEPEKYPNDNLVNCFSSFTRYWTKASFKGLFVGKAAPERLLRRLIKGRLLDNLAHMLLVIREEEYIVEPWCGIIGEQTLEVWGSRLVRLAQSLVGGNETPGDGSEGDLAGLIEEFCRSEYVAIPGKYVGREMKSNAGTEPSNGNDTRSFAARMVMLKTVLLREMGEYRCFCQ
jgi:hypothetical protein